MSNVPETMYRLRQVRARARARARTHFYKLHVFINLKNALLVKY